MSGRSDPVGPANRQTRLLRRLLAPEGDVLEQQVKLFNGPANILPGALLYLILPVGVDSPAFDAPAAPPLLVLDRRRRQRFAKQFFDPLEAECHLFLPARQPVQK